MASYASRVLWFSSFSCFGMFLEWSGLKGLLALRFLGFVFGGCHVVHGCVFNWVLCFLGSKVFWHWGFVVFSDCWFWGAFVAVRLYGVWVL